MARLREDKEFLGAPPKDQKAYLSTVDPEFAKASPIDQNAYLANIIGEVGATATVNGHLLQFVPGVSKEDQNKTLREYRAAVRHIVTLQRLKLIGEAFAGWMLPMLALYAFGWAIGWVRRGFLHPRNP